MKSNILYYFWRFVHYTLVSPLLGISYCPIPNWLFRLHYWSYIKTYRWHETRLINIKGKLTPIDCEIVPVVEWFNSIPGVRTISSCEGDYISTPYVYGEPYILFYAELDALKYIHDRLCVKITDYDYNLSFLNTECLIGRIETDFFENEIRHCVRFEDRECLEIFKKEIEKEKQRSVSTS